MNDWLLGAPTPLASEIILFHHRTDKTGVQTRSGQLPPLGNSALPSWVSGPLYRRPGFSPQSCGDRTTGNPTESKPCTNRSCGYPKGICYLLDGFFLMDVHLIHQGRISYLRRRAVRRGQDGLHRRILRPASVSGETRDSPRFQDILHTRFPHPDSPSRSPDALEVQVSAADEVPLFNRDGLRQNTPRGGRCPMINDLGAEAQGHWRTP